MLPSDRHPRISTLKRSLAVTFTVHEIIVSKLTHHWAQYCDWDYQTVLNCYNDIFWNMSFDSYKYITISSTSEKMTAVAKIWPIFWPLWPGYRTFQKRPRLFKLHAGGDTYKSTFLWLTLGNDRDDSMKLKIVLKWNIPFLDTETCESCESSILNPYSRQHNRAWIMT